MNVSPSALEYMVQRLIPGSSIHIGTTVAFVRLGTWEGSIDLTQPIDQIISSVKEMAATYKLEIDYAARVDDDVDPLSNFPSMLDVIIQRNYLIRRFNP